MLLSLIYIWPDDTWIFAEDYDETGWSHKSDDFTAVEIDVSDLESEEEIDKFVYEYNHCK